MKSILLYLLLVGVMTSCSVEKNILILYLAKIA